MMEAKERLLLSWKPVYSVGVASLDEQHARLIFLLNELRSAIEENHGCEVLERTLGRLTEYAEMHFAYEEQLMERCDFPDLEEHRRLHADAVSRIRGFRESPKLPHDTLCSVVLIFVQNWILNHIMGADKAYTDRMQAYGLT